jgi:thymidine phosphorylase
VLAQEIIRRKRDGHALESAHIHAFVDGLADESWSDAQAAAMAMAIFLKGLADEETVTLTRAMRDSGAVLDWSRAQLPGPILDKHSTGGVGDKVSLILAPLIAACGGFVPMISGRGLGHTGGTLDKLESIPGYRTTVPADVLERTLREAGCAIVGASRDLAPADRRLYAIRDVTSTVESLPLICASILSKKLAAGLQGLVLDVKVGNGAFAADLPFARALARALVDVAAEAGLPTRAWITDMNQVLGRTCGNALEVRETLDFLAGRERQPRLLEVTLALAAEMLHLGGLVADPAAGRVRALAALEDGRALERFARMVAALGGPADFVERAEAYLPAAPVRQPLRALRAGIVAAIATREVGLAVLELGGGRRHPADAPIPSVGLSEMVHLGDRVAEGDILVVVHATDTQRADAAAARLASAITVGEAAPPPGPVLLERVVS